LIETFQQYLNNGSYTSEDLVRTFLARIAEVNDRVHTVAELNPDALTVARALDRERKVSGPRRYTLSGDDMWGEQVSY
jgi:amidase